MRSTAIAPPNLDHKKDIFTPSQKEVTGKDCLPRFMVLGMRRFLALLAALLALTTLVPTGAAMAGGERPVVVELYTSQSCGPCVPADTLLTALSKRSDVIALTLAVNYWDILGWKDTLAIDAAAARQKSYAAALGRGGVYTPQMIVDGKVDLVGNREDSVVAAIDDAQKRIRACVGIGEKKEGKACFVPVSAARAQDGAISVDLPAMIGRRYDSTVWLLYVRPSQDVRIGGGENKGRTLHYTNVVRAIRPIGKWNGAPLSIRLTGEDSHLSPQDDAVILLQRYPAGPILGASLLAGTRPPRRP